MVTHQLNPLPALMSSTDTKRSCIREERMVLASESCIMQKVSIGVPTSHECKFWTIGDLVFFPRFSDLDADVLYMS